MTLPLTVSPVGMPGRLQAEVECAHPAGELCNII